MTHTFFRPQKNPFSPSFLVGEKRHGYHWVILTKINQEGKRDYQLVRRMPNYSKLVGFDLLTFRLAGVDALPLDLDRIVREGGDLGEVWERVRGEEGEGHRKREEENQERERMRRNYSFIYNCECRTTVADEDVVEYVACVRVELLEVLVASTDRLLLYGVDVHVLVDEPIQSEVTTSEPVQFPTLDKQITTV